MKFFLQPLKKINNQFSITVGAENITIESMSKLSELNVGFLQESQINQNQTLPINKTKNKTINIFSQQDSRDLDHIDSKQSLKDQVKCLLYTKHENNNSNDHSKEMIKFIESNNSSAPNINCSSKSESSNIDNSSAFTKAITNPNVKSNLFIDQKDIFINNDNFQKCSINGNLNMNNSNCDLNYNINSNSKQLNLQYDNLHKSYSKYKKEIQINLIKM